jgi:hypothetical protein
MKKSATALVAIAALCLALPAYAVEHTIGSHDETSEDFTIAGSWAAASAATPGTVAGGVVGTHLLITEIGSRGLNSATLADSTEFIEIFNPTSSTVDLSTLYLSDAQLYYQLPITAQIDVALSSTDFAMKFPDGATIAPGGVKVIAADGGRYQRGTGVDADFMLFNAGGRWQRLRAGPPRPGQEHDLGSPEGALSVRTVW